ncbi:hypothetical protein [Bradyrhizobium symbiodeficiens]|uniref:hypothetical protein n=1 Tax=Bradyrhizobium symbiodeficiens TaxID=1404367 RepID=UPI00140FD2CA|nr:hypothetical protein [Bradyrhizobium symbiodeficiens]QIO98357.1 hypothetical protein HAU86_00345 [Bradyrhizobium symbiodeficiens]
MSWLQFIVAMTSALAWPLVILALLWAVRKQLASLAERILELSFGGATVKFGQLLSKGTEILEDAQPVPSDPALSREQQLDAPSETVTIQDSFNAVLTPGEPSHIGATESVFLAFEGVEHAIEGLRNAFDEDLKGVSLLVKLSKEGYITEDLIDLYINLRNARALVAHGKAQMPNVAEALEFSRQASYLRGRLMYALEAINAERANKRPPQ